MPRLRTKRAMSQALAKRWDQNLDLELDPVDLTRSSTTTRSRSTNGDASAGTGCTGTISDIPVITDITNIILPVSESCDTTARSTPQSVTDSTSTCTFLKKLTQAEEFFLPQT